MPNITGSITDALEVSPAFGTVTIKPYGTDIRVEGSDVRLGVIKYDISELPAPLTLDAGSWTVTVSSRGNTFVGKSAHFDLQTDTSWGAIFEGLAQQPALTPTLVTQAQAAATAAEASAAEAEATVAGVPTMETMEATFATKSEVGEGYPLRVNPNDVQAEHAATVLDLPTPDGTGQATHPDVLHIPGGWGAQGHPYWMGVTPYTFGEASVENPCLLSSPDGDTWTVPPGVSNPLATAPASGWNADTDLTYDEVNDRMLLLYKETYSDATTRYTNLRMFTYDGATTSGPTTILSANVPVAQGENLLSPAMLKDGDTWKLWAVNANPTPNALVYYTADDPFGPWTQGPDCTFTNLPAARDCWHLDVVKVAGEYHAAMCMTQRDKSGQRGTALWFAVSRDGQEWTLATKPLIAPVGPDTNFASRWIYRSSMVPRITGSTVEYDLYVGSSQESDLSWWVSRTTATIPPAMVAPGGTRWQLRVAADGTLVTADPAEPDMFDWSADDLTLADAAPVASWTDRLGSVLTQANATYQPAYVAAQAAINGQPEVLFGDEQGDFMLCTQLAPTYKWSPPFTVTMVLRPLRNAGTRYLLRDSDTQVYLATGKPAIRFGGNTPLIAATQLANGTAYIVTWVVNGPSSAIYLNGALNGSGAIAEGGASYFNGPRVSGADGFAATSHLSGGIAAIKGWRGALTEAQRTTQEQRLATKYGITLA